MPAYVQAYIELANGDGTAETTGFTLLQMQRRYAASGMLFSQQAFDAADADGDGLVGAKELYVLTLGKAASKFVVTEVYIFQRIPELKQFEGLVANTKGGKHCKVAQSPDRSIKPAKVEVDMQAFGLLVRHSSIDFHPLVRLVR